MSDTHLRDMIVTRLMEKEGTDIVEDNLRYIELHAMSDEDLLDEYDNA
jgi:hypothetical protein